MKIIYFYDAYHVQDSYKLASRFILGHFSLDKTRPNEIPVEKRN